MTPKTRIEKLETVARETGETIERPTAYTFLPFGSTPTAAYMEKLEAAERLRLGKPDGYIFFPYSEASE